MDPLTAAELLGLDHDQPADAAAVKHAYRVRAKNTHPDRPGGSEDLFKQTHEAFALLADGFDPDQIPSTPEPETVNLDDFAGTEEDLLAEEEPAEHVDIQPQEVVITGGWWSNASWRDRITRLGSLAWASVTSTATWISDLGWRLIPWLLSVLTVVWAVLTPPSSEAGLLPKVWIDFVTDPATATGLLGVLIPAVNIVALSLIMAVITLTLPQHHVSVIGLILYVIVGGIIIATATGQLILFTPAGLALVWVWLAFGPTSKQ